MFAVFRDLIRYNIEFTIGLILVAIVVVFSAASYFSPVDPSLIYMTIPDQPPGDPWPDPNEGRPLDETERPASVGPRVQDLGPQDVGGHQVGRELDAGAIQTQDGRQRVNQHRLAQARLPDQQRVSPGQDRRKDLFDHLVLAHETPFDAGAGIRQAGGQGLDLLHQKFVRRHDIAPAVV